MLDADADFDDVGFESGTLMSHGRSAVSPLW